MRIVRSSPALAIAVVGMVALIPITARAESLSLVCSYSARIPTATLPIHEDNYDIIKIDLDNNTVTVVGGGGPHNLYNWGKTGPYRASISATEIRWEFSDPAGPEFRSIDRVTGFFFYWRAGQWRRVGFPGDGIVRARGNTLLT